MNRVLFLCTGNYYRSRFAEFYFRHLVLGQRLPWEAFSRGLALCDSNDGPLSLHTREACRALGIAMEPLGRPQPLQLEDLAAATLTIAVKETEHRPLLRQKFPEWEQRVEYWEVHDLDMATPAETLPQLRRHVEDLVARLAGAELAGGAQADNARASA